MTSEVVLWLLHMDGNTHTHNKTKEENAFLKVTAGRGCISLVEFVLSMVMACMCVHMYTHVCADIHI